MSNLFIVDVRGFQATIAHEAARILMEPVSNALDTRATEVLIRTGWSRGYATLLVEDNHPEGFNRLADTYTMYAPSTRKGDAQARGRFGLGEKEFIALCYPGPVEIRTTTGAVTFDGDRRIVHRSPLARRPVGSAVQARVRLTRDQYRDFCDRLECLIVPDSVDLGVEIDGVMVENTGRRELRRFVATLPTILANDAGFLTPTERKTEITLHPVHSGESPLLLELGVPVVVHNGHWHINVHQKIPLSRSRDSVTPAYLRKVHTAVLDAAADLMSRQDARLDWVTSVLPYAAPETVREVIGRVHGADAVIADPSCPEATKRAIDLGRPVIHGGTYSAEVWRAIKTSEALAPAGAFQELRGDVPVSADGAKPLPPDLWRPDWRSVVAYAQALGEELTGRRIAVRIYNMPTASHLATCGPDGVLTLNAGTLSRYWWRDQEAIDRLLIHELAHLRVADHLSDAFHEECCRLGARLRGCSAQLASFWASEAA